MYKKRNIILVIIGTIIILLVILYFLKPERKIEFANNLTIELPERFSNELVYENINKKLFITPVKARQVELDKKSNGYLYHDIYKDTDIFYEKGNYKLKETLIFKDRGHPRVIEFRINNHEEYHIVKNQEGEYVFYDLSVYTREKQLSQVFKIERPFVEDDKGNKSYKAVTMDINESSLVIKIDEDWLREAKYPVKLDPTVEINIINLHSHPERGEEWIVEFTTQGTADLTITPADQATIDDDEFTALYCGDEERIPQILEGDVIFYPDWVCEGIAKVIHKTLLEGSHTLEFNFGGQIQSAFNETNTVTDTFDTNNPGGDPEYYININNNASTSESTLFVSPFDLTVLYKASSTTNGNIGGRSGADSFCTNNKSSNLSQVTNIHAFISITTNEEIRDLPSNYGYQSNEPVYWLNDTTLYSPKMANNWADMFDGSIIVSGQTGINYNSTWWTGSLSDGSLDTTDNWHCNNFTDGTATYRGKFGQGNVVSQLWVSGNGNFYCYSLLPLFCVGELSNFYATGQSTSTIESINVLENRSAGTINSFFASTTISNATSTITIQFSTTTTEWYNASGTLNASTTLSDGTQTIDLSGLGWTGDNFYYKLYLSRYETYATSDYSLLSVDEIRVNYTQLQTVKIYPDQISASDTTAETNVSEVTANDAAQSDPMVDFFNVSDGAYTIAAGQIMHFDSFDASLIPSDAIITSAVLYAEFGTESTYNPSIFKKVEYNTGAGFADTNITPYYVTAWTATSSNLYAYGVDTPEELSNLQIRFESTDTGANDSVYFDYVWVEVSYVLPPTISSAANQEFEYGQTSTAISPITVTSREDGQISSTTDIRISIASSSVDMEWDTTDITAIISGTASTSVSTTVSYDTSSTTLIIDVTEDFTVDDYITITGLSYTNFNSANTAASGFTVTVGGTGYVDTTGSDDKTVMISGKLTVSDHTLGQLTNQWLNEDTSTTTFHYRYKLNGLGESVSLGTTVFNLSSVNGFTANDITNIKLYKDSNYDGEITTDAWGDSGYAYYNNSSTDQIRDIAIDSEGNIYASGNYYVSSNNLDWRIGKWSSDGSLDTSWGDSGYITINFSIYNDSSQVIEIGNGGYIYAGGYYRDSYYNNETWVVGRWNANGELDTSWGDNGYYIPSPATTDSTVSSILFDDGYIYRGWI